MKASIVLVVTLTCGAMSEAQTPDEVRRYLERTATEFDCAAFAMAAFFAAESEALTRLAYENGQTMADKVADVISREPGIEFPSGDFMLGMFLNQSIISTGNEIDAEIEGEITRDIQADVAARFYELRNCKYILDAGNEK